MPNSSQIRASETVLQITLKPMIKGYHQKLLSCAIPTASFYLYFSFSCGLILESVCVIYFGNDIPLLTLRSRGWSSQVKKKIAFGWTDFLNQFTARSYKTDSRNEAGEKKLSWRYQDSNPDSNQITDPLINLNSSCSKQTHTKVKKNWN